MGYLGGSESYKWGRMDQSLDPSAGAGKHDMWCAHACRHDIVHRHPPPPPCAHTALLCS
eukprot:SAG22_NODE_359_length_11758_cov_4.094254_14_plen_59_part_00